MSDWADVKSAEMFGAWQDEFELTGDAGHYDGIRADLAAALRAAAKQEREQCAKVVEGNQEGIWTLEMVSDTQYSEQAWTSAWTSVKCQPIAAAIRARGSSPTHETKEHGK